MPGIKSLTEGVRQYDEAVRTMELGDLGSSPDSITELYEGRLRSSTLTLGFL